MAVGIRKNNASKAAKFFSHEKQVTGAEINRFFQRKNYCENNRVQESFLPVAEEVAAVDTARGFLLTIFRVAGILF